MALPIYFAPLQGYTEDVYRRAHAACCGGVDEYYTPFMRVEHGEVRKKDCLDIRPAFNLGVPLALQFIARDGEEMRVLLEAVERQREGWNENEQISADSRTTWADADRIHIDLNMGCPFPLQVKHGRGAGILPHIDKVEEICRLMALHPEYDFSVKMRLGVDGSDEWSGVLALLNDAPLRHITLHPRVAKQQYKGTPDLDAFAAFAEVCRHPLVYNGDLMTVEDISRIERMFPSLKGLMIGRGLLARPTLALEYKTGVQATDREVVDKLLELHESVRRHYVAQIPGEAQQLAKLRTFWDYAEPTIGHKAWKKMHKAGNMHNYMQAVGEL